MVCYDCPRNCGVNRSKSLGFCHEGEKIRVAKIIENFMWEEPCISGEKGALAIFFSGCNLKCSFCQNKAISHKGKGKIYSSDEFKKLILSYDLSRFSTIDLITPTHFSTQLAKAFEGLSLPTPVVWNSSGYEKEDTINKISSFVNVFLPDFKYYDDNLSEGLSNANNYFSITSKAISAMKLNKPQNKFKDGVLQEGVLIRHLVLPGSTKDSFKILEYIKSSIENPFISLMSQFVPFGDQLNRKLYPLEYKSVVAHAQKLGLINGYIQEFSSANEQFVPDF